MSCYIFQPTILCREEERPSGDCNFLPLPMVGIEPRPPAQHYPLHHSLLAIKFWLILSVQAQTAAVAMELMAKELTTNQKFTQPD